ncbi:16S rRNA processing protein RimM [Ruminococcaceae bacterium YRB3002]|nr:16S rRNA processing protein RimM [Ruminococcaceae bacterium YRB3002]
MNGLIIIGKIVGVHGVRGELKVYPITDDAHRFLKLKDCFLCKSDKDPKQDRPAVVKSARIDKEMVLIKLEGLDDRTLAEEYRGLFIAVTRENAVKLPEGHYFVVDLIGLEVIDDARGPLGRISDCYETGANHIIEVKRKGKKDLLIPYLNAICYEVDLEGGTFRVRLPEGLYEIYE